ncbi:MAG: hypothetical protein M3332_11755 [Actinomycetota bacterium]|nr:hypothetical protein [Actinomycetota bacterium]
MIVEGVKRTEIAAGLRLSAAVRSPSTIGGQHVHFTVAGAEKHWLLPYGDAFLAALLMPAMRLGEELIIDAPVSRRLLRTARTVMDIYTAWWDHLRPVHIRAEVREPDRTERPGVGLFFTTGVDSFYSLLTDLERDGDPLHEPVTHLLFANFEEQSGQDYDRLLGRVHTVAEHTGRQSLVVDTNVRTLTEPIAYWPNYHGAALGAVALALQGLLGRCLIAASDQYRHLPPLGSHPVLDHLWSTESLEIVHDGAEATRTDKVERRLAGSPLALKNLTVCWLSKPAHNCGICEKCLRTMIAFELTGALGRCATLPCSLDLDLVRQVPIPSKDSREAMLSVAAEARNRGRHDLADAAEESVRRSTPPNLQ